MNKDPNNTLRTKIIDKQALDEYADNVKQDNLGSRSGNRGDVFRGAPDITWFSLSNTTKQMVVGIGETPTVYVRGYRMYDTNNIFLSASVPDMFINEQQYGYFEKNYTNRLKTEYPKFTGVVVPQWDEFNDNTITFELPVPTKVGSVDLIIQGPAGYTISTSRQYPFTDSTIQNMSLQVID